MLTNYVVQADLLKYYPKLASYLPSTQSDFSTQITEAFNIILDDIRAKEIEARSLMIPLDLKRAATSTSFQHILTSSAETTTTTGTHIRGVSGFKRFVCSVSAMTGTSGYAIKLQGSNDQAISDSTEPSNWTDIATISPIATGTTSSVFQAEYHYYRYINTVTAGTPSITFTLSLVENGFDRWVIHKALELIMMDLAKIDQSMWEPRMERHRNYYENALNAYKFTMDANDDNLVTNVDILNQSIQTSLSR